MRKVKKSQVLLSASWRAGGQLHSSLQAESQGASGANPSLRAEVRWHVPALSTRQEKRDRFSLSPPCRLFYLSSLGFGEAHLKGRSPRLLSPSMQMLISSRNNLPDTPGNNLVWASSGQSSSQKEPWHSFTYFALFRCTSSLAQLTNTFQSLSLIPAQVPLEISHLYLLCSSKF